MARYLDEARTVLERHGGRPHGWFKAQQRRCLALLPALLRAPCSLFGLAYPATVAVPDPRTGRWRKFTRYV